MLRKLSDLLLGVVLTLILIGLVISGSPSPVLQAIVAIPALLFVPGNALVGAIFPASNLTSLEKFLFAIGLSTAVMILSGLVLNLTSWGLQTKSWLLIIAVFTLLTSALAIWRRWKEPLKETAVRRFRISFLQASFLGLAFVVIGFSLKLSFTPQAPSNIQGYSSLWISPQSSSQPDTLMIGIQSQEFTTTDYTLVVTYNGQLMKKWLGISLAPGSQWQQSITLPSGQGPVEASLYRTDSPGVIYRHVSISLTR